MRVTVAVIVGMHSYTIFLVHISTNYSREEFITLYHKESANENRLAFSNRTRVAISSHRQHAYALRKTMNENLSKKNVNKSQREHIERQ